MNDLMFNIRIDKQPEGGFSPVIVFEPQSTPALALENVTEIVEVLCDLGWECGRTQ